MAKVGGGMVMSDYIQATPKKTRQGNGKHTKVSATSRNKKRKIYRGQGK